MSIGGNQTGVSSIDIVCNLILRTTLPARIVVPTNNMFMTYKYDNQEQRTWGCTRTYVSAYEAFMFSACECPLRHG